jgi:hypothetical protein
LRIKPALLSLAMLATCSVVLGTVYVALDSPYVVGYSGSN